MHYFFCPKTTKTQENHPIRHVLFHLYTDISLFSIQRHSPISPGNITVPHFLHRCRNPLVFEQILQVMMLIRTDPTMFIRCSHTKYFGVESVKLCMHCMFRTDNQQSNFSFIISLKQHIICTYFHGNINHALFNNATVIFFPFGTLNFNMFFLHNSLRHFIPVFLLNIHNQKSSCSDSFA